MPLSKVFDLKGFNLNTTLEIDPDFLTVQGHDHAHQTTITMTTHGPRPRPEGEACDHPHHHAHDDDVKSFAFKSDRAFNPTKLEDFLGAIVQVYGPKMLRYKGVLFMKGSDKKVIFQGVHQMMGSDLGPKWAPGEKKIEQDGLHRHRPAQGNPAPGPGRLPRLGIFLAIAAPSGRNRFLDRGTSWLQSARLFARSAPRQNNCSLLLAAGITAFRATPARRPTVTKTPAKTLAPSTATATGADAAAPKARAKPATKVSSSADGDARREHSSQEAFSKGRYRTDERRKILRTDTKLASAWKTKAGKDLTEPELMAMPESEYMGEKQLEFFRAKLQALKDDLLSNAGETTEHLREDTSIVPDPADRATIEEEHALELRTRDRERKLLKKISQSIGRIDAGDYGYCDETGEPIGLGRLLARPTATLSLEAQQRREMKQKMFGD